MRAWLSLLVVLISVRAASAGDWTDTDCQRWLGTPQYAACVNAQRVHSFDCERWTRGEREWAKCQHAKATREEVDCYKASTVTARNECRAQLVGAATRPHLPVRKRGTMRADRLAKQSVATQEPPTPETREAHAPRRNAPQRTGPLSWSNIRPEL